MSYTVSFGDGNDLLRNLQHIVKEILPLLPFCDITGQLHDQSRVSPAILEN